MVILILLILLLVLQFLPLFLIIFLLLPFFSSSSPSPHFWRFYVEMPLQTAPLRQQLLLLFRLLRNPPVHQELLFLFHLQETTPTSVHSAVADNTIPTSASL